MIGFVPSERMRNPETAAWIALRFARAPVSLPELARAAGDAAAVFRALDRWRAHGLVDQVQPKPETYLMAEHAKSRRDPPPQPRRLRSVKMRSARQRMWSAARVLKAFDIVQICMAASVGRNTAQAYLSVLKRAGFLERVPTHRHEKTRWKLVRPTGPLHPTIRREQGRPAVVDRNTGERFFLNAEVNHVR
jgi:hypothetical protein